ncbi:hypothetical protein B0H17DRAFT_1162102 [Mycena rosella]|uniref:Uncharacterized protein n=1 Tax=Mycena rosella TaxID=1033263 RepID=A0AAD7D031_MYCRO|nr:hypothetical protein B0H17DRAFT_1162102 [Mycena rosella]
MSRVPGQLYYLRQPPPPSQFLPPFAAPSTPPPAPPADGQNPVAWAPFRLGVEFEFAQFHFVRLQSSEGEINNALDIWAASVMEFGGRAPWRNAKELYAAIDKPTKFCTRDVRKVLHHQLACPDFKGHVDVVSYQKFNHKGQCVWSNFMSGDWAWKQADLITADKANHGCAFVAAVGGSDKTTVSVATGHQEYHPSYLSPSVLMGTVRCAHGKGVLPVAFHAIPKIWLAAVVQNWCPKSCDALPDHLDDEGARLRTQTKTNTLIMCFDPGILWDDYGIHADIVPFTHGFPRTDIYELLSFDLLHQVIKGMFKDHLVSWVNKYLHLEHGEKRALKIIQDIDHRISAVPEFPGLCRFHDGRDFSQWTGDDSKVLMKINLATVAGYIPSDMVKGLSAFMDFCYLVCLNAISTAELASIQNTLHCFHQYHQIFVETGHSLVHYVTSIQLFGSLNGLCLSIPESKHIKAVKEPWQHSSRFKSSFTVHGMMTSTVLVGEQPQVAAAAAARALVDDENNDDGVVHERGYLHSLEALAAHIHQPLFPDVFRRFLDKLAHGPPGPDGPPITIDACPVFAGCITVHHSAIARFYAPSHLGGAGGMYREHIRSNPNWHGYARRDTVLVNVGAPVMGGIVISRVQLFFSFSFGDKLYECALVHWLVPVGNAPDPDTGIWVVELERKNGVPVAAIINLDAIARASHLISVYGTAALPEDFHFSDSLNAFNTYFVNPHPDHHMHKFLK